MLNIQLDDFPLVAIESEDPPLIENSPAGQIQTGVAVERDADLLEGRSIARSDLHCEHAVGLLALFPTADQQLLLVRQPERLPREGHIHFAEFVECTGSAGGAHGVHSDIAVRQTGEEHFLSLRISQTDVPQLAGCLPLSNECQLALSVSGNFVHVTEAVDTAEEAATRPSAETVAFELRLIFKSNRFGLLEFIPGRAGCQDNAGFSCFTIK